MSNPRVVCEEEGMFCFFKEGQAYSVIESKMILNTKMYKFSHLKAWFHAEDFSKYKPPLPEYTDGGLD